MIVILINILKMGLLYIQLNLGKLLNKLKEMLRKDFKYLMKQKINRNHLIYGNLLMDT